MTSDKLLEEQMEKRKEEEGNQGNGYTKQKATTRDVESSEGTFSLDTMYSIRYTRYG